MRHVLTFFGLSVLCAGLLAGEPAKTGPRPIAGGVVFRTDDNGPTEYWVRRMQTFDKHGLYFGAAINLLAAEDDPAFIAMLKKMQAGGHDLTDHTPSHSNIVMTFSREEDLAWVKTQPGFDHFIGKTACLQFTFTVPPADQESRLVTVKGNRFSAVDREGADRWFQDREGVYFPTLKVFCRINHREMVDGVYTLKTMWSEDSINLPEVASTPVQLVNGHPTREAMELLAKTAHRICDRQGLKRPVTYVAPGNAPHLTRDDIKATYAAKYGYLSAAVYPAFVARVFNEADPSKDAIYGMQWGDVSDEGPSLAELKNDIANQLARNKVVIVGSHILSNPADWPAYFTKMDAMLAWMKAKRIPVKSHAAWGKILYQSGTKLTGNTFPPMDRDLDEDGNPDGFELVNSKPGPVPAGSAAPEKRMLSASVQDDYIFRVQGLGGLPHGSAEIGCWASGPAGSTIEITVHGAGAVSLLLKEGWNFYKAPITIAEAQATARIDFVWKSKVPGTVSVCGGYLAEAGTH